MGPREQLGRYGAWQGERNVTPELAAGIEAAGYGALWLGSPATDLTGVEALLDATGTLVVATGIVNVWRTDAADLARAYARVADRHGDRFLLGVGTGHREAHQQYEKPYETLARYVDDLLAAGVPGDRMVLAALGPKVLRLAAERTAGAHPYLVPVEHTRRARAEIGAGPLLAPEHKVVFGPDRELGREKVATPYLDLVNYTDNLRRLGWTDADLTPPSSDALIDALVAHGTVEEIAAALRGHLEAGADHVPVQILGGDLLAGYQRLAPALTGPGAG
jgi:probable F420-dependent oxidoreductase